jgi:CBS domain-containing protein
MKVQDIMTRDVKFCGPDTNLAAATEILWRSSCGTLPILDSNGKPAGVMTDRDMCIAMGTRNWAARDLAVRDVASYPVFTCGADDEVREALKAMGQHHVRRLPVVNGDGKVVGILSLDEIALRAEKAEGKKTPDISYEDVVNTMKAIYGHRAAEAPKAATLAGGAAGAL